MLVLTFAPLIAQHEFTCCSCSALSAQFDLRQVNHMMQSLEMPGYFHVDAAASNRGTPKRTSSSVLASKSHSDETHLSACGHRLIPGKVFVRGFPDTCTAAVLKAVFIKYAARLNLWSCLTAFRFGALKAEPQIVIDKKNNTAFAFVQFADASIVPSVVSDVVCVQGARVHVSPALKK
jgi:hypothetical protein